MPELGGRRQRGTATTLLAGQEDRARDPLRRGHRCRWRSSRSCRRVALGRAPRGRSRSRPRRARVTRTARGPRAPPRAATPAPASRRTRTSRPRRAGRPAVRRCRSRPRPRGARPGASTGHRSMSRRRARRCTRPATAPPPPRPARRGRRPPTPPSPTALMRRSTASTARVGRHLRVGPSQAVLADEVGQRRLADAAEAQRDRGPIEPDAPFAKARQDVVPPHRLHLRRWSWQGHHQAPVRPLDPPAGRRAASVGDRRGARDQPGLLAIDGRHGHAPSSEEPGQPGLQAGVDGGRLTAGACDGLTCQVVGGRAQAAGQDHEVGAGEAIGDRGGDRVEVIGQRDDAFDRHATSVRSRARSPEFVSRVPPVVSSVPTARTVALASVRCVISGR